MLGYLGVWEDGYQIIPVIYYQHSHLFPLSLHSGWYRITPCHQYPRDQSASRVLGRLVRRPEQASAQPADSFSAIGACNPSIARARHPRAATRIGVDSLSIHAVAPNRTAELTPLSRHQSRCVDGPEQGWFDRLTSLALRTVQRMRSPLTRCPLTLSTLSFLALTASLHAQDFGTATAITPPAKPPSRFSDRQGSWFEPTWRDGGMEPSTPS
eukprot:scaffold10241_cov33-Phaeocystis_antarctica.AAC.1